MAQNQLSLVPSEIVVWADNSIAAEEAASSLLAQSEHSSDSLAILVSKNKNFIKETKISLLKQLKDLPRKTIAQKSLKNNGALIYAKSDKKIISILNTIAPEHIEIATKNFKQYIKSNN